MKADLGFEVFASIAKGIAKGLIGGFYHSLGDSGVRYLINKDIHILPLVIAASTSPEWRYPPDLPERYVKALENARRRYGHVVLWLLSTAREIAHGLPKSLIEKMNGEWMARRIQEIDPRILDVILNTPGGREWLEKEAELWRRFLTS